jgi:hypothetical protein
VRMVVDEPGGHETAARVDDACAGRAVRVGRRVRSDGDQAIAADRDSLCAWSECVSRPDSRVPDDDVGFLSAESARKQ